MGEFSRRVRRDHADLSRRHGNRSGRGAQTLPFRHFDRRRRLLRPLSRHPRLRALRDPLAMGSSADRRDLVVDDVGGGRLRGDDRDRLQSHRDGQDHSRRLLRQRPRHGVGPRRGVRALRHAARLFRRGDRRGPVAAATLRAVVLRPSRQSRQRAGDEIRRVDPARARRPGGDRRQRSGVAGLSGRHGACAGLSPQPRTAAPDADHRLHHPDAVLLPEGRLARRLSGARRLGGARRHFPRHQNGDQVRRHPAADPGFPLRPARGHVHHLADVDRSDFRHDLSAVRPDQPYHRPRPVHGAGDGGDRQRGRADADRPALVLAVPSDTADLAAAEPTPAEEGAE